LATVDASLTWALYGAELKTHLGITGTTYDAELQRQWSASKQLIDAYLKNPFVDDSDADEDIPGGVIQASFELVARLRASVDRPAGLSAVKTGDLSQNYDNASMSSASVLLTPIKHYLIPHRKKVWK
jgi:hypothetical protein